PVLESGDFFVLSSRYEGFPNVVLEAMAAGCACIAFDCPTGPADIIRDGINGILVPPEDTKGLAAAMERVMEDENLRKALSEQAVSVREKFCEDKILGKWVQVLDRLTEDNGYETGK
ncbi:MAG: glycosyltransferase, partial [Desulfobacterales bacterium]